MQQFNNAVVIGAGTMGHGIAQVLSQTGLHTTLVDREWSALEKAYTHIKANLQKAVSLGKITQSILEDTLERIKLREGLEATKTADIIIEAVPENLELKKNILAAADAHAPATCLLASNTSSLNIAKIAQATSRPQQVVGLHFFNPVHLMKLLEIVYTEQTAPEALESAQHFAQLINKDAILVKNSPGFATSRLGICFALEAIRMFEQGVASAEDIDKAMVLGYGHPMGPLKLTDLVGLDIRLAIAESLHKELGSEAFNPPPLLRKLVEEGKLGKKSGQGFYVW